MSFLVEKTVRKPPLFTTKYLEGQNDFSRLVYDNPVNKSQGAITIGAVGAPTFSAGAAGTPTSFLQVQ